MNAQIKSGRMRSLAACMEMAAIAAIVATLAGCGRLSGRTTSPGFSKDRSGTIQASPAGKRPELEKTRAAGSISQRFVRAGTAIDVELAPAVTADDRPPGTLRVGDDVKIRFHISDAATGRPIIGARPAAWLAVRADGEPRDLGSLTRKVASLSRGDPLSPPELDLNQFYVVALNDDATITVVDPRFGFGGSRLLALVQLPGVGEDWALTDDGNRLFVSVPSANRVVAVDTINWKIIGSADVPRPSRLVLQGDGHYLWAVWGRSGAGGGVTAIDVGTLRIAARIETGVGPHDIAMGRDDLCAFVTNQGSGTLSVVDVRSLGVLANVPVGVGPVAVAYSAASGSAYVADEAEGVVSVVASDRTSVVNRMAVGTGVQSIRFAPGARVAFLARQAANEIVVIDAALDKIIRRVKFEAEPDDVAFTDRMAYIRQAGSPMLGLIPLDGIAAQDRAAPVIDVPIGRSAPGRSTMLASAVARASADDAVLIANPTDQAIYYYKEGLSAPQGSFRGYGHVPRAVLAVDRSLRPVEPGTYQSVARLRRPGQFDLAFFLDSPRLVHCFELDVASDERSPPPAIVVDAELVGESKFVIAGQSTRLRLRLFERESRKSLAVRHDIRLLAVLPGRWQRFLATEAEQDAASYAFDFKPPRKGLYFFYLESVADTPINIPTIFQVEAKENLR